jgi:hypothetical protein
MVFTFILALIGTVGTITILPFFVYEATDNIILAILIAAGVLFFSLAFGLFATYLEPEGKLSSFFIAFIVMQSYVAFFLICYGAYRGVDLINKKTPRGNISFTGRVMNSDEIWVNNRLVLIYLENEEMGRNISALGKSNINGDSLVTDGFFKIEIPNTYKITTEQFSENETDLLRNDLQTLKIVFGDVSEGFSQSFFVPSRKLTYTIKILEGDINALPPEILQSGSTRLSADGQIVVVLPNSPTGETGQGGNYIENIDYGTRTEFVETNKLTIPINNCAGSMEVSQMYSQTQTFVHQYTAEVGVNLGVEIPMVAWLSLVPELQASYGYENGQIDTQTVEYNMAAAPGTNIIYTVTWNEVWESGTANVSNGSDAILVPFRAKTNLIYDIASEKRNCP